MANFLESISLFVIIFLNSVTAYDSFVHKSSNFSPFDTIAKTAHISPELINELKDFENLISKTTIDEIAAKYYVIDGNFRTALKYLRSQEFDQLQKQLLSVPEVEDVLKFLHLTDENATTMHMGATKMPTTGNRVAASLDKYSDAAADSYKRNDKMTTNTGSILTKPQTMPVDNAKEEAVNALKVPKMPQTQFYSLQEKSNKNVGLHEHDIDDDGDDEDGTANANSIALSEQQPLVHIELLEDLEVKAKVSDKGQQQHHHHHKYKHQHNNSYYHSSLGTFTSFVEEVLQHLQISAYQQMIKDKCQNNTKFAKFYQALRSPVFKPYIETLKSKPNIESIIKTLNAHDVDINSLEPIAFKVISWGPNV